MVCFTLHTWIFGSCCFLHPPPKSKDGHTSIPLIWRSEKRFWAQRYWCPNHILERVVQNWCSVVKANFSKWFPPKNCCYFSTTRAYPRKKVMSITCCIWWTWRLVLTSGWQNGNCVMNILNFGHENCQNNKFLLSTSTRHIHNTYCICIWCSLVSFTINVQ